MTPLEYIQSKVDKPCKYEDTFDDLGLDSLDFIDLVRQLEMEYNVIVADSCLMKVKTVGDLIDIVSRLANTSPVCR